MFIGSIDKPSRLICENILQAVDPNKKRDIYVGCSGNFTFDRIAASKGFRVHSNDVSLYSSVIAGIVTNNRFKFTCQDETLNMIFSEWDDSAQTDLIKIMFAAKYGQFIDCKNDFQKTMLDNYIACSDQFYNGTKEKFEKNKVFDFQIAGFYYGDFKEHIKKAQDDSIVFLYAPTYKGGYEKLFSFLNDTFEYEHPEYELFDSKEAGAYYSDILATKEACIYSDILYPETEGYLKGEVEYSKGKKTVYLFSSVKENSKSYFLSDPNKVLLKSPKIISPTMELDGTETISIIKCKMEIVNHYKHLFMSAKVNYSTGGDFALAFFINNEIFGFASFASSLGTAKAGELLFLHSDFVVPSKIERLSKLLLYLLRSKEVYTLISRHYFHAYTGLQTSVYTSRPVSMKYRGIFQKAKNHDGKKKENKLTYFAEFTKFTKEECLQKWLHRKPLQ